MTWLEYTALGYATLACGLWLAVRANARRRGTTPPPVTWLPSMPLMFLAAVGLALWMRWRMT